MHKNSLERLKSLILAGLILLSLILVVQLWFGRYYMPGGTNELALLFDRTIKQPIMRMLHISEENNVTFTDSFQAVMKAKRIMVNTTGTRQFITEEDANYNNLYATIQDLTATILQDESRLISKEVLPSDEWLEALNSISIYVDYGVETDSKLLSVAMGGNSQSILTEDLDVMRDYIIVLEGTPQDRIAILLKDYSDGEVIKYVVEQSKTELENDIAVHLGTVDVQSPSYAFELNFHKETNDDGSVPNVVFDPLILVNTFPTEKVVLKRQNLLPMDADNNLEARTEAQILKTFSINSSSMRKYTDVSGASVYVENEANLEISPNGFVEYTVLPQSNGLRLAREEKASYSIYDTVNMGVSFLRAITATLERDQFSQLRISSRLTEDSMEEDVYTLTLDYYVDGTPVLYRDGDKIVNAVEMEIENGYLKSYRQHFNYYDKTGEVTVAAPMIAAVDQFVAQHTGDTPVRLRNVFLGYVNEESDLVEQKWCIDAVDSDTLQIVGEGSYELEQG